MRHRQSNYFLVVKYTFFNCNTAQPFILSDFRNLKVLGISRGNQSVFQEYLPFDLLPDQMGTRQFDGKQFGVANLSASQFGGKINKNDLSSLALKRQQKSFVMS